jgi:hypothetical protein
MEKIDNVIVYKNGDFLALVVPTVECELSLQEIAIKDVPDGVAYKIIPKSSVPEDWEFRDAWEVDFSNPDGYGIGHDKWFAQQTAKG